MKHICFFSGDITNSGGTERVGTIIANELSKNSEYKISFISLVEKRGKPFFEIENNIERFMLYKKPVRGITHIIQIISRLKKIVKNNHIDILVDIDGILDMYSLGVKFFSKIKVISWEHFNFYQNPAVSHRKITRRLAGRYADAIVTLTNEDKGYYMDNLKVRCPITYIHNPVMNICNGDKYNINSKTILSVGRLTYQKGFDMLVEIAKEVFKNHEDWQWIILGEGEDRQALEKKIKEYGLEDKLILKGNVANVEDYYRDAAIFVLTSRYEGLPMTLLETKPFKLPIVSFNIKTGPRECIIDKVNGFLVDEFNLKDMAYKINRLIKDKELRLSASEHALDNIDKFQLKNIIKQWNELINSI